MIGRTVLALALLLTGCAGDPVIREVTVTKEVPVPYHEPCPAAEGKPVVPRRVAEEHPVMPVDPALQARILAAKILEWITYGEAADGVMTACSKRRGESPTR